MSTIDDLWVLEWHHRSNNIHVQPLAAAIGINRARFCLNSEPPGRYVPIFVGARDEVIAEAEVIRPQLVEREKRREIEQQAD